MDVEAGKPRTSVRGAVTVITQDALDLLKRFPRLAADPDHLNGHVRIANTRMPVAVIVELVASGQSLTQILEDFPQLTVEDLREALLFAAELVHSVSVGTDTPSRG
jgi:uncharacterized protein (DUF433 family)